MKRTAPMQDATLIEALNNATSLELFQLNTLIERLLADPRRVVAIRALLHLGQTVRFYDWRDGQMRQARIVAMKDNQVTLHEIEARREWKLPYAAIEPPEPNQAPESAPPAPPAVPKPGREDFKRGDKVAFDDRYLQVQVGLITRINQRTATVECDGSSWRGQCPAGC